jgi:[acyl-carrier-protein] S-malonyltransferase
MNVFSTIATPLSNQTHVGEHLFAIERLVVSPAAGVFTKMQAIANNTAIEVGLVLGHVGDTEVRSPFAGMLQNFIAVDGERVTAHQPIAWLRSH